VTDRDIDIAALVPHAGSMVLIDRVRSWNGDEITCLTRSHRRDDNPLRAGGGVPAIAGAEYGAQAAAIHGGLVGRPADGYLVALRDLRVNAGSLHDVPGEIIVHARCRAVSGQGTVYVFELREDGDDVNVLVSGRVTVALMGES
jgi:predicted hotdog family 3-hydroxylacyl-ACP dehydratase